MPRALACGTQPAFNKDGLSSTVREEGATGWSGGQAADTWHSRVKTAGPHSKPGLRRRITKGKVPGQASHTSSCPPHQPKLSKEAWPLTAFPTLVPEFLSLYPDPVII